MECVVRQLKPEAETIVSDLRTLADKIESGEVNAHTAFVVTRDRVAEALHTTLCGERLAYSHLMGLLAYAQAALHAQARGE